MQNFGVKIGVKNGVKNIPLNLDSVGWWNFEFSQFHFSDIFQIFFKLY